jgi:hypothetical protein
VCRSAHCAVLCITAPVFFWYQTPQMVDRTLTDMIYHEGIPMSGRCSQCKRLFTTKLDALTYPGDATRDFYTAFRAHGCTDQAWQRTVETLRGPSVSLPIIEGSAATTKKVNTR